MTTSWQPYSNHLGKLNAAYLQLVDNIEATSEQPYFNLANLCNLMATSWKLLISFLLSS